MNDTIEKEPARADKVKADKAPAPEGRKPVRPTLLKPRFKQAETMRSQYLIVVEAGVMPDDVLAKGFWQHVGETLRPGDRIEVLTDDMKWAGDLIVHSAGRLWATVKWITLVQFEDVVDETTNDKLRVQYRGPHFRYCVVDMENPNAPEVVRNGFETQEMAMMFLTEYRRTTKRIV